MKDSITLQTGEHEFQEVVYTTFIKLVKVKLKETLINLIGEEKTNKFILGKTTLGELGICAGITLLIDKELQTIHKDICILDTEVYGKFISDIDRDLFR